MLNVTIKKIDGSSGGSVVLSDRVFAAKITTGLMHQAVVAEATNSRQDTRDTKTRAEVAGGGRKPYRQKGTGRARQGSISSPHYRHGGIVFGPHPRNLSNNLPKKARRAAVASALSVKAADEQIMVVDSFTMDAISTKAAANVLKTLGIAGKSLIILADHSPNIYKSFRNIQGATVRVAPAFSVRDILDASQIVIVQGALESLDALFDASRQSESEEVAA